MQFNITHPSVLSQQKYHFPQGFPVRISNTLPFTSNWSIIRGWVQIHASALGGLYELLHPQALEWW
jgi:hypothetical protein